MELVWNIEIKNIKIGRQNNLEIEKERELAKLFDHLYGKLPQVALQISWCCVQLVRNLMMIREPIIKRFS